MSTVAVGDSHNHARLTALIRPYASLQVRDKRWPLVQELLARQHTDSRKQRPPGQVPAMFEIANRLPHGPDLGLRFLFPPLDPPPIAPKAPIAVPPIPTRIKNLRYFFDGCGFRSRIGLSLPGHVARHNSARFRFCREGKGDRHHFWQRPPGRARQWCVPPFSRFCRDAMVTRARYTHAGDLKTRVRSVGVGKHRVVGYCKQRKRRAAPPKYDTPFRLRGHSVQSASRRGIPPQPEVVRDRFYSGPLCRASEAAPGDSRWIDGSPDARVSRAARIRTRGPLCKRASAPRRHTPK